MKYNGVIFDFNGVLFWDTEWHVLSWQGIAKDLRGREMTEEELVTHMDGRPNGAVLSYLAGRPIEGKELLDLTQVKESHYRKLCLMNPRRFVLSPGAQQLLETLTIRNIPRTIATSSEITNLTFFIQHLHIDRWFDVGRIVYDDGSRPGKPAPDVYSAASLNIRLDPSECIVIEDSVSGLAAAHAAGIGYIVALGAPGTHARLLACPGVGLAIKSLRDFPYERLLHRLPAA